MKKTTLTLLALVTLALLAAFTSCTDDKKGTVNYYTYATLHSEDPSNFWFEGDSGIQIMPNHNSSYNNFSFDAVSNGSRAIIYFQNIGEGSSDNIHTVDLTAAKLITTKNAFVATSQAQLDSVGDDALYANSVHLSSDGKYIDLYISTRELTGTDAKYTVSMAENTLANYEAGYVSCDLRLKRTGTGEVNKASSLYDYISFRLPDAVNPVKSGLKGIYLRVKGDSQIKYLKVTTTTVTVARTEDVKE